ncbi:MAG: XdhC family protein, partial [bacterium]
MLAFWKKVVSKCEGGQKVFIAFVAANTAHSPGTTGAKLLVAEDGEIFGTIGGGLMEFNIIAHAKEALKTGEFEPEIQMLHHRKSGNGEQSGMICAGSQTNLYYLCEPERDLQVVKITAELVEFDKTGVLYISKTGIAVQENEPDIDVPQIQLDVKDEKEWLYKEQLLNFKRIAIIGGGHCALALSRVMKQLGYEVFVFETRENV